MHPSSQPHPSPPSLAQSREPRRAALQRASPLPPPRADPIHSRVPTRHLAAEGPHGSPQHFQCKEKLSISDWVLRAQRVRVCFDLLPLLTSRETEARGGGDFPERGPQSVLSRLPPATLLSHVPHGRLEDPGEKRGSGQAHRSGTRREPGSAKLP